MSVDTHVVEQVFAYLGLVMWSLQLAPQAYKTYRRKTTDGVSPWMMLIWALSGVFLGNYNIGVNVAVPLIIQPQLFSFIAYICLAQELYYGSPQWSRWKAVAMFIFLCIISGGLEIALLFGYWAADRNGNMRALEFFGVLPVVMILIGFLPQYYEIARERRVEGVSHLFLCMDFFGSIFSCISLAFRSEIDALTIVNYAGVALFDLGIFSLYYIFKYWNARKENQLTDKEQQPSDASSSITTSSNQPDDTAEKGLPNHQHGHESNIITAHSTVTDQEKQHSQQ
ncbi:hypothetical protein K492DRAFT_208768 [Lichtheimia hyalospora FSU 10163]|nr:hypothetical protein K492DRAFT_208768 [Lichtheimia hyalospora FSU 10163]